MSYTRTYHESVSGSRTVSVKYPASEHGGSTSVTVSIDIPVNIAVNVDTRQFDHSVGRCAGGVNTLAGAVVATSAAQVGAIATGANKVADTILKGFFKLIRSELTQQISENRARCEALFLKLNDMKAACLARKTQMERDFGRIAERYTTLFRDLDRELGNRVQAIDSVAFSIREHATVHDLRALSASFSTVPTLVAGEDSQARTNLGVCALRDNVAGLLRKAGEYLLSDRRLNRGIRSILSSDQCEEIRDRHIPVLYAEMDPIGGPNQPTLVADSGRFKTLGSASVQQNLTQSFRQPNLQWIRMDGDTRLRIETFLSHRIAGATAEPGSREARVGAAIMRLWQAHQPAVLKRGIPANQN